MGCFSYKCKNCGEAINSDSANGDLCEIAFIQNGEVKEVMRGYYDSYGRVFTPDFSDSFEWETMEWGDMVDAHFSGDIKNGFLVYCGRCFSAIDYEGQKGELTRSEDDPEQGWSKIRFLKGRTTPEIYHKVY